MNNLNELRDKIHENARAKGFYEYEYAFLGVDKNIMHALFAQKIALIHSELSEALEADRKNKRASGLTGVIDEKGNFDKIWFENYIKNTIEDKLADAIIHILDLCGWLGIDVQQHVELKMRYNQSCEHKHVEEY